MEFHVSREVEVYFNAASTPPLPSFYGWTAKKTVFVASLCPFNNIIFYLAVFTLLEANIDNLKRHLKTLKLHKWQ